MNILLIVYDNESFIHTFPTGIAYIASVLKKAKHNITIYQQDIHHFSDDHLVRFLYENCFDAIGIGVIGGYWQYRKLLSISKIINESKNRPRYFILGGHGPSPDPKYFLKKTNADICVIGEGEETIVNLFSTIENKMSLNSVKGISWRDGNQVMINERRQPIINIDDIPIPEYELFPIEIYRLQRYPHCNNKDFVMPVLSARGCNFKCNFCYRMDKGYRVRNVNNIMNEIKFLQEKWLINYIDFSDELLMSSHERVEEICDAIQSFGLKFKWFCNGRLNYAIPKTLNLMKKSGCVFINYGIECYDDKILKNMNKALTTKQIVLGIEATLASGISPGFNMIFGNIGEDKETIQKDVDFLLKYDDGAQLRTIRPVTPYPGTPLFDLAVSKGLLKDVADFYENKHVNSDLLTINFTNLSDNEFYNAIMEANLTLVNNYNERNIKNTINNIKNLYINHNSNFRGFRTT